LSVGIEEKMKILRISGLDLGIHEQATGEFLFFFSLYYVERHENCVPSYYFMKITEFLSSSLSEGMWASQFADICM
jgi:hypothetical protein